MTRVAILVLVGAWIVSGMVVRFQRAQAWQTDRTIWTAAMRATSTPTVRVLVNYGNALARDGDWAEALAAYARAHRLSVRDRQTTIQALIEQNIVVVRAAAGRTGRIDGVIVADLASGCAQGFLLGQGVGC